LYLLIRSSAEVVRKCETRNLRAKSLSVSSGRSSRGLHPSNALLQHLPGRKDFLRRNLWFIHYILSLLGQ